MTSLRGGLVVVVVVSLTQVLAGAARADDTGPRVVAAVSGSSDITGATLVGPSGQVFTPIAGSPGSWERTFGGGVAADVGGAVQVDGALTVCGRSTPMYRLAGSTWEAQRLTNRGRTVMSSSGAPVVAVGRHIYVVRKKVWTRLNTVPRGSRAVWAGNDKRAVLIDELGGLARVTEGAIAPVKLALDPGDHLRLLAGAPGATVYAISRLGAIYEVGATGAAKRLAGDTVGTFDAHAAAIDGTGALVVVGAHSAEPPPPAAAPAAPATDANGAPLPPPPPPAPVAGALAMLRVSKGTIALTDLALTGRVTALVADGKGQILVATDDGGVRLRAADGTWSDATLTDALVAKAATRASAPAVQH